LNAGDRVMASGENAAEIVYESGCVQPVAPGAPVVVNEFACGQQVTQATQAAPGLFGANAGFLVGGALVAGGVVAIAAASGDDDPASP